MKEELTGVTIKAFYGVIFRHLWHLYSMHQVGSYHDRHLELKFTHENINGLPV
jgi:hypothetical protein